MMEPIDLHELKARGPRNRAEELRLELYEKVNALGIGAQGLGGLSTVLDVKVRLPHARRLEAGGAAAELRRDPPRPLRARRQRPGASRAAVARRLAEARPRPRLQPPRQPGHAHPREIATWKAGERLLLSGKLLTGRDAAHKRIAEMIARGEPLPVDFTNRFIYYVGPVDAVRDEAVGPAGPTTSSRMDKFTEPMLDRTGLIGMVGKSERGPAAIEVDPPARGRLPASRSAAPPTSCPRPSAARAWSRSPTSAWKPSTSSR
jgi:fumarate hydratase, class I